MQRVERFPPTNARMVRQEEGPPMYRMLGYADRNNRFSDLPYLAPNMDPIGPFGRPLMMDCNQTVPVGPGQFGLPMAPLAFTTSYWDDTAFPHHAYVDGRPLNRLFYPPLETRLEAVCFPERAVPGSGINSRCVDSGCLLHPLNANPPAPKKRS